jgi:hypothetical protein
MKRGEEDTGVRCRIPGCLGTIVEVHGTKRNRPWEAPRIGAKNQNLYSAAVLSRRCGHCGVEYAFVHSRKPKEDG